MKPFKPVTLACVAALMGCRTGAAFLSAASCGAPVANTGRLSVDEASRSPPDHGAGAGPAAAALLAAALLFAVAAPAAAQGHMRIGVETPAEIVLGGGNSHARAITCRDGAAFESIQAFVGDNNVIAGMELCCTGGSPIFYEGAALDATANCVTIGEDGGFGGAPRTLPPLRLHSLGLVHTHM